MHHKSKWILVSLVFAFFTAAGIAQVTTTQIADTVHHADGTTATGSVIISWPTFTTSYGAVIPADDTTVQIASDGTFAASLAPNSGSIPIGSYYTAIYHLDDGSVTRQYWVVPQSTTPVSISSIESTVLPTSVAMQTASKSYVDTAIAAAQAGHPLDSSPLLLKAGDSMTGPLVLPADPVASMQASTKHYVDSAVTAVTANSSMLTGQTAQRVPLANGPTSANSSAAIGDDGQNVTVYEPLHAPALHVSSSPANCTGNGYIFTQFGCININVNDDGSSGGSTPRNLSGLTFNYNAYGPGGFGAAEGRSTNILGDSSVIAHAGIKNIWASSTSAYGVGDALFMNWNHTCNTGTAYQSDQGCQLIYNYGGQPQPMGPNHGNFRASVVSGGTGAQTPTFTGVAGCDSPLNQSCVPSPGTQMLDMQNPQATGSFTSASTGSPVPFLQQLPTTGGLPVASAWGYATNVNLNPQTTWDAPVAQTFTLQAGAGSFTTGLACVIGNNFEEQGIISAVSGASPTQTISIPLSKPEGSIAIFQGGCHFVSFNADLTLGTFDIYPAVSIDGHNLIYGYPGYSQMFGGLPIAGAQPETTNGASDPKSAFSLYCGARVTKLSGLTPLVTNLEPNGCPWAAGDAVEDPDFPMQKVNGIVNTANQNTPSGGSASLEGIINGIGGMGAAGSAIGIENDNFFSQDCAAYAIGTCGGNLTPPTAFAVGGHWNTTFNLGYMPSSTLFNINGAHPGQTSYYVLQGPWGGISNDSTGNFNISNAGLKVQNGLNAGGGGVNGTWTVGASPQAYLSITNNATASNVLERLIGGYSAADGTYHGGLVLGQIDGANNEMDKGFLRLLDEAGGFGQSEGVSLGVINNGSSYTTGFYQSSAAHGNTVSIANGTNLCPMALCLGGGASTQVDASGNLNSPSITTPSFTVNNSYAGSGFSAPMTILEPSTAAGGHTAFFIGRGYSTNDLGYFSFLWNGPGSAANKIALGMFGADNLLTIDPSGNGAFSGTASASNFTTTGSVTAAQYLGPATAPTGACSTAGAWAFSQDGHISFCNGSTWVQKM